MIKNIVELKPLFVCASLAVLAGLALPSSANADPNEQEPTLPNLPDHFAGESLDPSVYQGDTVMTCGWPSVIAVQGGGSLCTGTLIHPDVVMYAAHCGGGDKSIKFGEATNGIGKTIDTEFCQTNPSYNGAQGNDWAFCVLAESVTEIPYTPVAYGCELNGLGNGSSVHLIGFGNNQGDNGAGTKRHDSSLITNFSQNQNRFDVGFNNQGTICSGDSGGPAMIRNADGGWRAIGIASTKYDGTCSDAPGTHSYAPGALSWIEQQSGIDVSVCHDLNGNWNPGPLCGNVFSGEASQSYGTWPQWCVDAPGIEWSSTCGSDFAEQNEELNPPSVEIAYPLDGEHFMVDEIELAIDIDVSDDSPFGVEVEIEIEGMLQPSVLSDEPYAFEGAVFYPGEYSMRALARDFWGNEAWSETISISVGVEDGDDSDDNGDGDADSGDDDNSDSDDNDGDADSGNDEVADDDFGDDGLPLDGGISEDGCACNSGDDQAPAAPFALGLGLLGLSAWRRRR